MKSGIVFTISKYVVFGGGGGDGRAVNMSGQHVCVLWVRVPLLPQCGYSGVYMAYGVVGQGFDPGLQVFLCQQQAVHSS
jgi:hypothetical protein